jgi:hypothetical protein
MTQELAVIASAGVVMLLLMVVTLRALDGAAGDRRHPPTLVAGPLIARGSLPNPSVTSGTGAETGARCADREARAATA